MGIEEFQHTKLRLLVLDPSHKQSVMRPMMNSDVQSALKRIRFSLSGLKAQQYQIVCIEEGFVDSDFEYLVYTIPAFILFSWQFLV